MFLTLRLFVCLIVVFGFLVIMEVYLRSIYARER